MSSHCKKCGRSLAEDPSDSATIEQGDSLCADCRDSTFSGTPVKGGAAIASTYSLRVPGAGLRIAHFSLVRTLGSGSFGDVWLAEDSRLGRPVALKLPNRHRPGTSILLHEAKTAARLRHPHIVAVYEVGEEDGQFYIASELIDGITLSDFLSKGRPGLARVIELLIPIAEALQFAHVHGVVHRDVKPANILMDQEGKPYVTDFGLAKRLSADETISSQGQVIGTVRYMSPEQATGNTQETDARSDVYSLGVMMFEMLTGETPFRGNARAILQQKVRDDPPSLRLLDPSIPKDIETICLKCLEREPNRRFSNAKELTDELKRFVRGEPIRSRSIGRMERGWRWCKRRPAVSGLVLALFISLLTGLLGVSYFGLQSERNAREAKQKLYRSWMNLASSHVHSGNPAGVRDLLRRISADPDLAELRGFEFDYYQNLVDPIHPLGTAGNSVVDVAITFDGNTGAAINGGQDINVWDIKDQRMLRVLNADQAGFTAIDFSSANSTLAAGSMDGFLRIYEPLASDRMIRQLQHGPPIVFTRFSPDGRQVIAAGKTGAIRIWDTNTGNLVAEVPTGKGETRAIRFSPDGSRLFVARDDGRIREWSRTSLLETGLEKVPVPTREFNTAPRPVAMCFTDHGEQLVIAFYDGTILSRVCNDQDDSEGETKSQKVNLGLIMDLESVPHAPLVAMTTSTGNLFLVNLESRHESRCLSTHNATGRLARSGDGKTFLLGSGDGSVSTIATRNLVKPSVFWGPAPVRSIGFIESDQLLAAYENGEVLLWDLATDQRVALDRAAMAPATLIAVNSARGMIAAAGDEAGIVLQERPPSLKRVASLPTGEAGVSTMGFSPSGDRFAVAIRKGPIRLYHGDSWQEPRFEIPMEGLATSISLSLDGQLVAVATSGHKVELLDSHDGRLVDTLLLDYDEASVVDFCLDGATLAVGTRSGTILLYDIDSRKLRATCKGHTGQINALATVPESNTIVSAGRDKDLILWDLGSGDLVTRMTGHFRQVFTLAVSADGKTIASGGLEGDIRIWRGESLIHQEN